MIGPARGRSIHSPATSRPHTSEPTVAPRSSRGDPGFLSCYRGPVRDSIQCALCGGSRQTPLCEFPEFNWLRCECGLIFKDREPADEIAMEYEEEYFSNPSDARRAYGSRTRRRISKSAAQILDVLNHVSPGPLLDIGSSLGYTLEAAQQLDLPATGVDISKHAVEICAEMGFPAKQAPMDNLPFPDDAFQLVMMKHVLEHTPDPRTVLREVRRVMRAGAGLFVAVPHAGYRRAKRDPCNARFYLPQHGGLRHYIYYTPETLSRLLGEEGFKVVRIHPHLLHRRVNPGRKALEIVTSPVTALVEGLRTRLAIRKEFWVVAVKTP